MVKSIKKKKHQQKPKKEKLKEINDQLELPMFNVQKALRILKESRLNKIDPSCDVF